MTEMWKIALACFIGGVICTAVALLVAPAFWWLGIIAGFCAGYLAYEFGEVLRAIPIAFSATSKGFDEFRKWSERRVSATKEWFSEQHPYIYGASFLGLAMGALFTYAIFPAPNPALNNFFGVLLMLTMISFMFFCLNGLFFWICHPIRNQMGQRIFRGRARNLRQRLLLVSFGSRTHRDLLVLVDMGGYPLLHLEVGASHPLAQASALRNRRNARWRQRTRRLLYVCACTANARRLPDNHTIWRSYRGSTWHSELGARLQTRIRLRHDRVNIPKKTTLFRLGVLSRRAFSLVQLL
jgi:hypothetical protein